MPFGIHVVTSCNMFADDTKTYKVVNRLSDCKDLQKDLDTLSKWAKTWQMSFYHQKCAVMRIGKNPPDFLYTMKDSIENRHALKFVEEEKDLGVVMDNHLSFSKQITQQTSKANKILAIIRRSFQYLPMETLNKLYKSYVRPHLDYAVAIWNPILKQVQMR